MPENASSTAADIEHFDLMLRQADVLLHKPTVGSVCPYDSLLEVENPRQFEDLSEAGRNMVRARRQWAPSTSRMISSSVSLSSTPG
jgi:hypothetical protein